MISLRWILLLAGLAFILGLAIWEMRRSRQAAGSRTARNEPVMEHPAPLLGTPSPRNADAERPLPVVEWPPGRGESPSAGIPPEDDAPVDVESRPLLDWPPEGVRRICNLRLMPVGDARLGGRALRQSLLACGFVHGEFGIFHLAGIGNHVIVSAANLARPGMLDPDNMDYQRFSGINLFTVLPAAITDHEALDQLFAVSERLAERLDAELQDGEGRVLDSAGLSALRQRMLDVGSPNAAAGGG